MTEQKNAAPATKKEWQEPTVKAVANIKDTRGAVNILQSSERGVVYFS